MESSEIASDQIRDAIISGELKPGDRLVEQHLTELLGVSRHPIREALRILARQGFVELRRNRGATVSTVKATDVIEVYNIRMSLGKFALSYLFEEMGGMGAADLESLEDLAESAINLARSQDQHDTIQNDLAFQQKIIDSTGLPRTIRYFSELTGDIRRFNHLLGAVYTSRVRVADAESYILPLFHAIRRKKQAEAQRIWQAKFTHAVTRYLGLMGEGGIIDEESKPGDGTTSPCD